MTRRIPPCLLLAAALATLAVSPARADRAKVRRVAVPGWVDPAAVPATPRAPASAVGLYDVVFDRQLRHGKVRASYLHHAQQVLATDGISEAATVQIYFQPAYQRVDLHFVHVRRGAQVIDALELEQMRVAAVQADRTARLYSGEVEVSYEIPDVRVGDVVEVAYTVHGANPVLGGAILGSIPLAFGVPVGHLRWRALVPRGPLEILPLNTSRELARRPAGAFDELLFEEHDVASITVDGERPAWHAGWTSILYSSYASWADVARWAHALYEPAMRPNDEVRALVASLEDEHPARADRLRAAVRFVQDEIRYVAVPVGEYSHRPHPAGDVLRQRFGDCKDKTALLVTILRELGIPADPVMVDMEEGKRLSRWIPTPYAFDHVIVRAQLGPTSLWIDPTAARSREPLTTNPPFAWGLAARVDAGGLHEIPETVLDQPQLEVVERYRPADGGSGWQLEVVTTFRGNNADGYRRRLGRETREDVARGYLNNYVETFPEIEADGALEVDDDEDTNVISVTERYRLPAFYEDGERYLRFTETWGEVTKPNILKRSAPYALPYPRYKQHTIEVHVGAAVRHPVKEHLVDNQHFTYVLEEAKAGTYLRVTSTIRIHRDHVEAAEIAEFAEAVEEANELSGYNFAEYGTVDEIDPVEAMVGVGVILVIVLGTVLVIVLVNRGKRPIEATRERDTVAATAEGNGSATAAIWLGLSSVMVSWVPFIDVIVAALAIIFGGMGMRRARTLGGKGYGNATGGLALGVFAVLVSAYVLYQGLTTGKWSPSDGSTP